MPELKKIEHYLADLVDFAGGDSANARAIYESWGDRFAPRPFSLVGSGFQMGGVEAQTAVDGDGKVAFYCWNPELQCAGLTVEGGEEQQFFAFDVRDEELLIRAEKPRLYETTGTGEELEVVYDLIPRLRAANGVHDLAGKITRKEFLAALETLAGEYPAKLINGMKRLALPRIRELFRDACADTPVDELSDQLWLPLDGTYANSGALESESERNLDTRIVADAGWEIAAALEFYSAACRLRVECERELIIPFTGAEALGAVENGEFPLKLRVAPDVPLSNGIVIYTVDPVEPGVRGTFKIDLFDGDTVYGRMRCDCPDVLERLTRFCGCLPKSPSAFLSGGVDKITALLKGGREHLLSPPQCCALGITATEFRSGTAKHVSEKLTLDASQQRAWSAAVHSENPLVLIQGPPGTGKTFVLEQTLRELCRRGRRVLVTAPSNAAVDNICRRLADLPLLRFGNNTHSIAPDIAKRNWIGERDAVDRFVAARKQGAGGIYAGTGVGLLRDRIVQDEIELNGRFDDIVFDEAGMCALDEFLLCAELADRAVLFGDHRQLPPFPLSEEVLRRLATSFPAIPRKWAALTGRSALEYLAVCRSIPVIMLERSYRCQNPRLLRFSSTLFYEAGVKPGDYAEYYRLPPHEREKRYPSATMRFHTLSALPEEVRREQLSLDGNRPGVANRAEAAVCADLFYRMLERYRLEEISLIAPYRRQVELLRELLSQQRAGEAANEEISPARWRNFVNSRVATVDSFQGAESDVVIICYVRSNRDGGIGFVDDPNRINVAHTRCRREMHIVGDLECLKRQERSGVFKRLERTFRRDGEIVPVVELPECLMPVENEQTSQ